MKPFQIILIIIFLAAGIIGLLIFAGVIKVGNDETTTGPRGTVVMWGTVSGEIMTPLIDKFNTENKDIEVRYRSRSASTFNQDLLEAIASGQGPDIFLLPDDLAYTYANKISVTPYTTYPIASFRGVFASAAEVFLTSKGILAFPLTIDPLVMYYNRTILDSNNIVYPPVYWDDFGALVPILTQKNESRQIARSATALGQYSNVTNAKDILSALFIQAGNSIVVESTPGYFSSVLGSLPGERDSSTLGPILSFYTNFADPLNALYSWNKSLPSSDVFFSSDKLAFYFGFASDLQKIAQRNPNQNFGVAPLPQIKNSNNKATRAKVLGVAVSSFSQNTTAAYTVATLLATGSDFADNFAKALSTPPARRDLLAQRPQDSYGPVLYSSALYGKSWLDPNPSGSNEVFRNMVDSVLSNSLTPESALRDASGKLNLLLR